MQITLSLARPAAAATPSPRALRVAAMFGLGADDSQTITIIPPVTLDPRPGQIIFITGPSGGGKSTLLRLIHDALAAHTNVRTLRFDDLPPLPDRALVDCLAMERHDETRDHDAMPADDVSTTRDSAIAAPFAEPPGLARALELLSLAGLSDAFILLRRPHELSDGQRARLRLAQVLDLVTRDADAPGPGGSSPGTRTPPALTVIFADEFGATLDRTTAHTLARALRRWTRRCPAPVCFIAATTHDDLLEPLEPDVLIEKGLGDAIEIATREEIALLSEPGIACPDRIANAPARRG